MTAWSRALLPHGLWREGERHSDAELRPLSGADEAFLLEAGDGLSRAETVSLLLSRCVRRIGGIEPARITDIRDLTVGDREALLLHLRRLSFAEHISSVTTCPAPDCREPMDLELEARDLLLQPKEPSAPPVGEARLDVAGDATWTVSYRAVTGADQEAIARRARSGIEDAVELLLDRCVLGITDITGAPVPTNAAFEVLRDRLPQLLSDHDPQAEIRLSLRCPVCGHAFESIFDTANYLIAELSARGRTIFDEVHLIARRYHWSEADILSLGIGRRRRYLALIHDEMSVEARA